MKPLPEIVDNRTPTGSQLESDLHPLPVVTMASVLNRICTNGQYSEVKIAIGYFTPLGWKLVSDGFEKLLVNGSRFDILLGSKYDIERTDEFQKWFQTRLEGLPLRIQVQEHIHRFIEFLKSDKVRLAVLYNPFIHAKLYWFPNVAYVGSSNLTGGGLKKNIELNLKTTEQAALGHLSQWFDKRFSEGDQSYKEILINSLQDCKLGTREWTPFEVFLKIVYEHYRRHLEYEVFQFSIPLTPFQKEAVVRGLDAVKEFGGVMLADAVGLGKSFEGIEVVEALRRDDPTLRRVLIICPAQLKGNWETYNEVYSLAATVYTMERLSRYSPRGRYDIVLIDESHNLRHSKTSRWQKLRAYLSNLPETKVILLTATPVNTSMTDLYNQILIITKYRDLYPPLSRIGIPDLKDFFERVKMGDDVSRLRDALIVTRNRTEIRYRQAITGEDLYLPDGRKLVFPKRSLDTANYSILPEESKTTSEDFFIRLGELVDSLTFPQYSLRLFEEDLDDEEKRKTQTAVGMIKILLLKRLESSLPAAIISLKKQRRLLQLVLPALDRGYILNAAIADRLCDLAFEIERDDLQDSDPFSLEIPDTKVVESVMEAVIAGVMELNIFRHVKETEASYNVDSIKKHIKADLSVIDEILAFLAKILKKEDRKLEALYELIEDNAIRKKAKVLIFSYFKDTLVYLFKELKPRLEKQGLRTGSVHGGVAPPERARLVKAFAPIANTIEDEMLSEISGQTPMPEEEIDVLFSTDVLSEGQNLQDASVVINYDLHWNPVRLIQRIGRIDRLGSPHDLIHSYNFFPEAGLEELIRIVERLETRLADIDLITPSDAPVLKPEEPTESMQQQRVSDLTRIRDEDVSVLDSFEERVGLVGLAESRRALIGFLERHQKEYFDRIPLGIHSGFRTAKIPGLMVAIRILRGDSQPLTMWGFKPDEGALEAFPHIKRVVPSHGIITHMSFIERQILCSQETPRHLREDTTVRGALFEEVVSIAKTLITSLSTGIEIQETFAKTKYPRGNRKYAVFIRSATTQDPMLRAQCRPFMSLLATRDLAGLRKFLGSVMTDFDSQMRVSQASMKTGTRPSRLRAKQEAKDLLRSFLPHFKKYYDKYAGDEAEEGPTKLPKPKYELIGFLRLFPP